jgi:hypothetical protein
MIGIKNIFAKPGANIKEERHARTIYLKFLFSLIPLINKVVKSGSNGYANNNRV